MASDNEIMVLIYETVQKQLGEIKNSRVVMQTLSNRLAEVEKTVAGINDIAVNLTERIAAVEKTVELAAAGSEKSIAMVTASNAALKNTIDALRVTSDKVTNPSITVVSENTKDLRNTARELRNVHEKLSDELVNCELRMLKVEDTIDKMLKKQLLTENKENNNENE